MATGRPLELTQAVIDEAAKLIPRALYLETVAHAMGLTRETFYQWLKVGGRERRKRERGKDPDRKLDLHCAFSDTVKRALAHAEIDFLSQIQAAGTESWQAIAWLLERRHIGKWSLQRAEVRELKRRLGELEKAHGAKPAEPSGRTPRQRPADRAAVA